MIEKAPFDGNRFSTTKFYYDRVGNLTRIIDPEGYVTNQSYSERNFLKAVEKVMDSDTSNITQMEYDGEGAIQSIKRGLNSWTDPQYSEETYEYDMLGRRILTKDPEGKETQYEYDLNSNVISVTDRNKLVTSYQYDGLNRVIGRQNSRDDQKNAVHISYDLLGNKVQMSDSSGTTSHEYDPLNRLVKTNYESGIKQTYEYDDADRITGTKVLQGTLEQIALQNGYNKNGRLTRVSQNGSENEGGNGSGRNHSYEYDVIGRMVEENDSLTGIKTDYNYYNSGSIKGMSHRSGEIVLDSFNYAYDLRGNQTQKDENGTVTQYYYDPLSRLKTVLSPNDEVLDYKYDDLSNIEGSVEITDSKFSETSCLYDRNSRLLLKETLQGDRGVEQRFAYDLEGNLKTKEEVIKQSGNLATSKKTEYIFNGYNQLEKLITPDDRLVEYTYNGNGLRTGKHIDNQAINYYYDRGNIVLETSNNEVTAKNIRGNRLISRETSSGLYNYLHNAHGDVIKLLNENGDVVKDYAFDPYGKEEVNGSNGSNSFGNRRFTGVWQQEVEKIDNPFRYCGEYLDEESGLYYLRARYYDNETMRFISEDSVKGIVGDPLSLNLYSYCQGNPVRYSDPSGHMSVLWQTDDLISGIIDGGWDMVEGIIDSPFALISLGEELIFGDLSLEDIASMGIDSITSDYKYLWSNKGVLSPFSDVSDEDVRVYGSHMTSAFADIAAVFTAGGAGATKLTNLLSKSESGNKLLKSLEVAGKTVDLRRPYIRKSVRDEVEARAPRTDDGRFIDPNTGLPIEGKYDLGHKSGNEFWREKAKAEAEGLTQKEFNDRMNNPDYYQIEDPSSNRSRRYEMR